MQYARHELHPKRLVILIDELENLEIKFANKQLSEEIPLYLASLLEGKGQQSFVISGSDQERLKSDKWGRLTPKVTARRIGMLSYDEANRLITTPLNKLGVFIDGKIANSVLRYTEDIRTIRNSLVEF